MVKTKLVFYRSQNNIQVAYPCYFPFSLFWLSIADSGLKIENDTENKHNENTLLTWLHFNLNNHKIQKMIYN